MTVTAEKTAANLPAPTKAPLIGGARPSAIVPRDFEGAYRLAGVIAASGMAPRAYVQNGVANREMICVAILHGMEVGFTPMAALQSIAVINGSPNIWGDGMMALVEASGLLEEKEEFVETDKDGTPLIAVCRVKRVGKKWKEAKFTKAQAQKAELWNKKGPWTQYPHRMMQMRARSFALRDEFSDVLRGLGSAEEARDMIDIGGSATAPPEPTRAQFRQQVTDVQVDQDGIIDGHPNDQSSTGEQTAPAVAESSGEAAISQSTSPEDAGSDVEGWPLYDADGETIGAFGVTEWMVELNGLFPGLGQKDRRQFLDNNLPSAKAILADADVPEQLKAEVRTRFAAFLPK